ncbi:hypothetical protein C4D60_Mb09t24330 [Musa balbisiana]|uniref:NB-ARC domain-containing protein n=1 Tax=Musa balbisiana TaxID=52838 RepID=A0A4V4H3H3_MUSBA|nr:hypothetical protein C4D60_Mb09t24330 [Musa balbisiana]
MDPLTFAVLSNYLASLCKDLTSAAFQGAITAINKSQGSSSMDIVHEFDNLRKELRSIQSFLRDTENSKLDSESLVNWVEEVKDAARDVEAMTEQIVYYAHALVWNKSWGSKASAYIGSHLPKLKEEFETNIPQRRDRYLRRSLVRREEQSCSSGRQMRQPHEELPHETMGTDVVGMEQNEATVVPWLLGETDNSQRNMVISICGMGGLGKTCLVWRVYNNQHVKRHFDCSAWVSISKTYNAEELLRSIIRQIIDKRNLQATPDELDRSSRAALLGLLDQCLHQKRYVIVLDDVWSRNACNEFSYLLQNGKIGSRVIVTTRDHHVAASLSLDSHILNLQPLPESEAWSLFCKKAFWTDPNNSCPRDSEFWARRIVAKCDGLPLAILTLGSLMSSQDRSSLTWKHFYLGISSQLSNNEMLVTMSRSLMLGYDDLPYHLKQCYLYCGSVFPESRVIKKNWLLGLWVAEGLVEDKRGMTSEEVAEGYFDELILRSMLQVARKDESGKVKACRMHILMREVSLCVSKAHKLCAVLDEQGVTVDEAKARRISVQSIEKVPAVRHEEKTPLSRLRSLLFFVDDQASAASFLTMSPNLMLLKVLELRNVPIDHVPGEVFDLFNLSYLSLRDTNVEVLPKYVKRLKMLETLDLRGTKVICLPHEVARLKELRHLLMDCVYVLKKVKKGRGIINLVSDQATMKKIDDLLNQKAPRIKADTISWIRDMKGLLTLKTVEADETLIAEIAALVRLRRLGLTNVHAEDGIQLCDSISKMGQLLSLTIDAASDEALMLDSLPSPPPHLRKLVLDGQLWKVPPWFDLLSSLTHLYLLDSQLEATCNPIPHLEKLESLVHLTLLRAYNGARLYFRANTFLRLNSLNIAELKCLSQLDMEKDALPSLSLLHLSRCGDLQGERLHGIDNLPALRHLYLQDMPKSARLSLRGDHRLKASTGWESISKSMSWL